MKNKLSLALNESCIITAVRAIPDIFVQAEKMFNIVIFWGNEPDKVKTLHTVKNQCIGRLIFSVEDFMNGQMEIALPSTLGTAYVISTNKYCTHLHSI